MTKWTDENAAKLRDYLATHELPDGLGSEESACSVAAINLVLTGTLTDNIPSCMSPVIGSATIVLQDAMPHALRNSDRYKAWLPTAAGTGRDREQERLAVLLEWMWSTVLPELQGVADTRGFGVEWQEMCEKRTPDAAAAAADDAACADLAAACAARAAGHAADLAADLDAARAARAARAAAAAAAAVDAGFWDRVDPIGVLERMTGEPT
jgi:hypothetical protein